MPLSKEMVRTADGNRVPDAAASLMANDPAIIAVSGTSVPTAGTAATPNTPARAPTGTSDATNIQGLGLVFSRGPLNASSTSFRFPSLAFRGTLVDMGFSRTQVSY